MKRLLSLLLALAGHKPGDVGIIGTEHGIHIMFYKEDGALTYRDYMIDTDIRTESLEAWSTSLIERSVLTEGNLSGLNRDLVIAK